MDTARENLELIPLGDIKLTEQQDRITLKVDAYWETFHEEPFGRSMSVAKALETHGVEPYVRRFKATSEPRPLATGDIDRDKVGYLLIINMEGMKLRQNPTKEERKDIDSRIVLLDGFEIYPNGMPFLGQPSAKSPLLVQCLHGEAVLQVCIYPR